MKQNRDNEESLLSAAHLHSFSARVDAIPAKQKTNMKRLALCLQLARSLQEVFNPG
jgi:hypothetical protein